MMEDAMAFAEAWGMDPFPKVWEDCGEESAFPPSLLEDNALEGTPLA